MQPSFSTTKLQNYSLLLAFTLASIAVPSLAQSGGSTTQDQSLRKNQIVEGKSAVGASVEIPLPLQVRIVKSPEDETQDEKRELKSEQHEAADLDAQIRSADSSEKQVWINGVTLILSLIANVFLFWTLKETRRSAKASVRAADASIRSTDLYEKEFHITQRAYIFLKAMHTGTNTLDGRTVNDYVFVAQWENSGNTPAVNVKTYMAIDIIPKGEIREPFVSLNFPDSVGMIIGPRSAPGSSQIAVPIAPVIAAYEGDVSIYIYARAEYMDIFDSKSIRHVEQCWQLGFIHEPATIPPPDHPSYVQLQTYGSRNSFS